MSDHPDAAGPQASSLVTHDLRVDDPYAWEADLYDVTTATVSEQDAAAVPRSHAR